VIINFALLIYLSFIFQYSGKLEKNTDILEKMPIFQKNCQEPGRKLQRIWKKISCDILGRKNAKKLGQNSGKKYAEIPEKYAEIPEKKYQNSGIKMPKFQKNCQDSGKKYQIPKKIWWDSEKNAEIPEQCRKSG